jgi:hypothetical protein
MAAVDHAGDEQAVQPDGGHEIELDVGVPVIIRTVQSVGGRGAAASVVDQDVDSWRAS